MNLQELFKKTKKEYVTVKGESPNVPTGLMRKCKKCGAVVLADEVIELGYVCPKCGGYFRMHAYRRIEAVADPGSFTPWFEGMETNNPLEYQGYPERIKKIQEKISLDEAVTTGEAKIAGIRVALAVMDGRFLMASMGEVVGEKITRTVEKATDEKLPVIIFACSGGARMQEGMVSLMQMAKTSAALKRHSDSGNLYISVLTDPTTGGVTASFAMLGDVIIAEPNALIGFAGPRVIEQTIGQKLPKGFQRSEFLLEHGFIDAIIERKYMRKALARILKLHNYKSENKKAIKNAPTKKEVVKEEVIESSVVGETKSTTVTEPKLDSKLQPWDRVLISRKADRPVGQDYIRGLFTEFIEFHGDRYFSDDKAIIGGVARFGGKPVTVIAQSKGHNTKENIDRNFGMPSPDGYRKALRLMKQAEKFGRPVICFVDTPGAFCGLEAEERGQGEAIARNLFEMSSLKSPILTIVIGEGGSGGALAMAVADEVWMLENSVYSILSPEGYASILWKDGKRAKEAAGMMKMTAADLMEMGMVEKVFAEPKEYNIESMAKVIYEIKSAMEQFLEKSEQLTVDEIVANRYNRFRRM